MVKFENISGLFDKILSVKILITDVDGVMTDAGIYYSERGEELKRFSMRDGMGLELVRKFLDLRVIIITGENSPIVSRRAEKLNISDVYLGIRDKAAIVEEIAQLTGMSAQNFCYVGDDVNDLRAMKMCGFRVAPSDAVSQIKAVADYITDAKGGHGVLREVADLLLYVNNLEIN